MVSIAGVNITLSGSPEGSNSLLLLGFISLIDLVHTKAYQEGDSEHES